MVLGRNQGKYASELPILHAQKLKALATSVHIKRLLSLSGHILIKLRSKLSAEHANMQMNSIILSKCLNDYSY